MSDIPHEHDEDPIIPDPSEIDPRPGRKRNRPKRIEGRPVERDERDERPEPPRTQTAGAGKPPKRPKKTAVSSAGDNDPGGDPSLIGSRAQRDKFEKFLKHPLRDGCLRIIKRAVDVAALPMKERGFIWGVTVCPDADSVIRLNVGNLAQLSVMRKISPRIDPTGEIYYVVAAIAQSALRGKAPPRGLILGRGFEKYVTDSGLLYGEFSRWGNTLFDRIEMAAAFAEHAERAMRPLPNKNWHNPMVNSLLDHPRT